MLRRIQKKRPTSSQGGATAKSLSKETSSAMEGSDRYQMLKHHNDASPDWVTDMILQKTDSPPVKAYVDGKLRRSEDYYPRLVVVEAFRVTRSYGKGKNQMPVIVYDLVLMDGSETFIKAVTNSALSSLLKRQDIMSGTTLVLKEYRVLQLHTGNDCEWKKCLLLKNFDWKLPPDRPIIEPVGAGIKPVARRINFGTESSNIVDTEETTPHSICYDRASALYCRNSGMVLFTEPTHVDCPTVPNPQKLVNFSHSVQSFAKGEWILHKRTHTNWIDFVLHECLPADRKLWVDPMWQIPPKYGYGEMDEDNSSVESDAKCECVSKHGMESCVVKMIRPRTLDANQIFLSCSRRFAATSDANFFSDLEPRHKRWCMYWWYAVNVYQIRGSRSPLPSCFVDKIRALYPNKNGEPHVGFVASI
ncbi:hypothetical protein SEMRO_215_G089150.1 [Seminavis robusta]|uniref:Uncharacterized protein n=1 Tax=Seminavis robusta TaxID=568900 RepID=A0A9N8DQJ0_9STRA|nr:hypothetical protein SEMRO_215_G089150.1 [Seminavis robusta]|eukprot:Sro215_g089150.1 n/a (418) ;mRNA; r:84470-85723